MTELKSPSPTALSDSRWTEYTDEDLAHELRDSAPFMDRSTPAHASLLREAARRLAGREKQYFVGQEDGSLKPLFDEAAIAVPARCQFAEELVKWCEEMGKTGQYITLEEMAAHIRRLAGLP